MADNEEKRSEDSTVDLTTILYIVGGIPAIIAYIFILFFFAHACNAPA